VHGSVFLFFFWRALAAKLAFMELMVGYTGVSRHRAYWGDSMVALENDGAELAYTSFSFLLQNNRGEVGF